MAANSAVAPIIAQARFRRRRIAALPSTLDCDIEQFQRGGLQNLGALA
jgi:hypothetical protein